MLFRSVQGDLGDIDSLPLAGIGLVTASALLDLMSRDWLEALAVRLQAAQIPFYGALNYDGQMHWSPEQPEDAAITAHFNMHQRGDKGTGPALGPDSGAQAKQIFAALGFTVSSADSPWRIGPDQGALHAQLLDGIGAAAGEAGHDSAVAWTAGRHALIATTQAVIGHMDVLVLPPQRAL